MSCLLRRLNGFRLPRLPGVPRLPPTCFIGKMLLIIYILLNSYIYHNFRKKHTWGNRGNRGNQGLDCTQSGPIAHDIRDNPLPCQKKVVILHSHSALGSHSRYRSTKSAGDQGLCSPQKSEIFGGPKKDASLTKVSSRVRDLQRSASPPLHEITTIAPHYLHDSCVSRV